MIGSQTQHTILVIDDEPNVQESLKIILQYQGYRVHTASSAADGLHILSREKIDLIVLDLKIPGADGFELLKKIRAEYPHVKVIIITGYGTFDIARQALALGAIFYFDKPIDLDRFIENIRKTFPVK